jgi:hypothetical protein
MTGITSLKFAISYYYCDYSDLPTLNISSVLGTIIKQLLERFTDIPGDVEGKLNQCYRSGTKIPDHNLLAAILYSVVDLFSRVFILIDGIDELGKEEQNIVLSVVKRLGQLKSIEVKVFVSSRREETYITKSLQNFRRIDLSTANTTSDIACFIKGTVRSKIESEELILQNPSLEHDIVRALLDGAQGMYALKLPSLCGS